MFQIGFGKHCWTIPFQSILVSMLMIIIFLKFANTSGSNRKDLSCRAKYDYTTPLNKKYTN